MFFFFLNFVVVAKLMSAFILRVHNSFWKIMASLFKNSTTSLFLFSQNFLPLSSFIYLESQTVIVLSLWSSKFGLDGSILMVHEWMNFFFISFIFWATTYPTPFGCLSLWAITKFLCLWNMKPLPYFSFSFSCRISIRCMGSPLNVCIFEHSMKRSFSLIFWEV